MSSPYEWAVRSFHFLNVARSRLSVIAAELLIPLLEMLPFGMAARVFVFLSILLCLKSPLFEISGP